MQDGHMVLQVRGLLDGARRPRRFGIAERNEKAPTPRTRGASSGVHIEKHK